MPVSSALMMACTVDIGMSTVGLLVSCEDREWRWVVRLVGGDTLASGAAENRLAAQVEAQHAFEFRLKRAGIAQRNFTGYRWKAVDAESPATADAIR